MKNIRSITILSLGTVFFLSCGPGHKGVQVQTEVGDYQATPKMELKDLPKGKKLKELEPDLKAKALKSIRENMNDILDDETIKAKCFGDENEAACVTKFTGHLKKIRDVVASDERLMKAMGDLVPLDAVEACWQEKILMDMLLAEPELVRELKKAEATGSASAAQKKQAQEFFAKVRQKILDALKISPERYQMLESVPVYAKLAEEAGI